MNGSPMFRPEATAQLRRWSEPAIAVFATFAAAWIVGLPGIRFGWVSLALGVPLVLAGAVWLRVAVRRAMDDDPLIEGGQVFVEERRVLYVGALGNTQLDLDEVISVAVMRPTRPDGTPALLLTPPGSAPVSVPLSAEGTDNLLDALTVLPGFSLDRLASARKSRASAEAPFVTIWRRESDPRKTLERS